MKIELIKKKPSKKYSVKVEEYDHVDKLCKFLRNHEDKKLEVIINGKSVKFASMSERKRFAAGFQLASRIMFRHVEEFYHDIQTETDKLKAQLNDEKNKNIEYADRLRTNQSVTKIRLEAWTDTIEELKDNCEILYDRLKKYEGDPHA